MLYFPQLLSGATGQFPLVRRARRRTVRSEQADGREWKVADSAGGSVEWLLKFRGLGRQEWIQLETLFHRVEGRKGSFVFLDPTDNLLTWSGEPGREAWTKDPYVGVAEGLSDPFGGGAAARLWNEGPVEQRLEQALEIPGWYRYCLSLWVRSETHGEITLYGRTGTTGRAETVRVFGGWRRVSLPVDLASEEELVRFGVELGPATSVQVYGMQVEAQVGASHYKRTGSRSGVYREARFGDDVLEVVAEGPDCFACEVRVVATG